MNPSWGNFDRRDEDGLGFIHVAPIDEEALLLSPHTLTHRCLCHPYIEQCGYVLVHNPLH